MKRNGHGGKELVGRSILRQNGDSLSGSEQAGEVWIRGQSKPQIQDEQVADDVSGGERYDVGDQAVWMVGFFSTLPPPSSRLAPPPSFYGLQLRPPFSYSEQLPFPSAFGHPTPSRLP